MINIDYYMSMFCCVKING